MSLLASSALWIASGSVGLYGAFLLRLRQALPRQILRAPNAGRPGTPTDPTSEALARAGLSQSRHLRVPVAGDSVSVLVRDPVGRPRATVLAVHGVHNEALAIAGFAERNAGLGCRTILPDLPGHGYSSGRHRTFGAHEARALSAVLDALADDLEGPLLAVGFSYGGAVCCQLAALDPRVDAVASIAAFSDLEGAVWDRLPSVLPHPTWQRVVPRRLVRSAVRAACRRGGFAIEDADATEALRRARRPFFGIHGDADPILPIVHTRRLIEAAGPLSEAFVLPGGDHDSIFRSETVRREVDLWIERRIAAHAAHGTGTPPRPAGWRDDLGAADTEPATAS